MIDEDYIAWRLDQTRNNNRVVLVDLHYASGFEVVGHGRYDAQATLNAVTSLKSTEYTNGVVDIEWAQPELQPGYEWSVWVNGEKLLTTSGGSFTFDKSNYGSINSVEIAVASERNDGAQYSKLMRVIVPLSQPWIAAIRQGKFQSWEGFSNGPGIELVGTVRLSSKPYPMENTSMPVGFSDQPYDDWLTKDFVIEESLDDLLSVGSIGAVNLESYKGLNWQKLRWRGYKAEVFHGDEEWARDDFRQIASCMNEGCRTVGPKQFEFDVIDLARHLNRTFVTEDYQLNMPAKQALQYIVDNANLTLVDLTELPDARNYSIDYTVTPSTTALDAIQKIADSIGAFVRTTQIGGVQVFIPQDQAAYDAKLTVTQESGTQVLSIVDYELIAAREIDSDSIQYGGVRMIDNTPSYSRVLIKMSNGAEVSAPTGAYTGDLAETFEIDSVLSNVEQATELMNVLKDYYAVGREVWELKIIDMADVLQTGDQVTVEHEELTDTGIVRYIRRTPMSAVSIIEVQV